MKRILSMILILLMIILVISCSRTYDPADLAHQGITSCESCHLDQDRLIATAEVDTTSGGGESSGEG